MDEQQTLIIETAKRIFADQCDKPVVDAAEVTKHANGDILMGTFPASLWQTLAETGLTQMGIDPDQGGAGGSFADALLVLAEAGAAAAPIPLAEHLIALQLLAEAGVTIPEGIVTLGFEINQGAQVGGVRASFSESADWLLVIRHHHIELIKNENLDWHADVTIAGQSVAVLDRSEVPKSESYPVENAEVVAELLGARARVVLMSGAMGKILEMSVSYVSDREQFGRSLSKFQAIQHQLAVLAGEVASCQRAADSVLNQPKALDVAIAKARVGEAVVSVAEVAHQVHGAIGYTLEHGLNHRTRRLWQWRDDFGSERYWQLKIGHQFCADGADQLWAGITNLG